MESQTSRRPLLLAFAASFAVYLTPLLTPHAVSLFGGALILETFTDSARREPAWVMADWSLALAAQAALFALACLRFRDRRLPLVAFIATFPVLWFAIGWLYLIKIPAHFLIERVEMPDKANWAAECGIADASIAPLAPIEKLALAADGETLIRRGDLSYALLKTPGCTVTGLRVPASPNASPISVARGGVVLVAEWEAAAQRYRHWLVRPGSDATEIVGLPDKPGLDGTPILSTDGSAIAWVARIPGTGPPLEAEVRMLPLNGGHAGPRIISLRPLGLGTFVLLRADLAAGRLLLARNSDEFLELGFDGAVLWGPVRPGQLNPQERSLVPVAGGWIAWDAYREREAYLLGWELPSGSGLHRVPRGRAINSAAVHPDGGHLAFSVSSSYSIGDARDAVSVLALPEGAEVFRKNLDRYARSEVAFPGRQFFAYSDFSDGRAAVRVHRLPPPVR